MNNTISNMKLSKQAWNRSSKIQEATLQHPFIKELVEGTLRKDIFAFYVEQDRIFLNDFARCLAIVASKISTEHVGIFLKLAQFVPLNEEGFVQHFFKKTFPLKNSGLLTPATVGFTSYLIRLASTEPVEVAVAAILPAYWIYREIGHYLSENSVENNPYANWIETLTGEDFNSLLLEVTHIFDELASRTTDTIRQKMLENFHVSSCYEWHFWNDAYHMNVFDHVNLEKEKCGTSCC